ncbi:hypothetical protein [Atlantibacter hermannii]|uniref:hypothetical protein n=1 Tax=Atlantibacter hermannii TaxID=565 RepID=UPI002540B776|nr:hypothetical protein [Atlantibacter hermannii]WIF59940.1 hypothetical protein QN094_09425 [Atlantibacter hermannii]
MNNDYPAKRFLKSESGIKQKTGNRHKRYTSLLRRMPLFRQYKDLSLIALPIMQIAYYPQGEYILMGNAGHFTRYFLKKN